MAKKIKLRDRLRRAVKDEEKIDDILAATGKTGDELVEMGDLSAPEGVEKARETDGDGMHVHVHLGTGNGSVPNAGSSSAPSTKDAVDGEEGTTGAAAGGGEGAEGAEGAEQAPAWFTQWAESMEARLAACEAKVGGGDKTSDTDEIAGEEAGEDAKEDEAGKTKDSASLADNWRDMVSMGEIIAPGFKPANLTFDAKADRKITVDASCKFRRAVLEQALSTDEGQKMFGPLLGGRTLDKMTCDAQAIAFRGAAEIAKARNNGRHVVSSRLTFGDKAKAPPTPAEINVKNRDFWKQRGA